MAPPPIQYPTFGMPDMSTMDGVPSAPPSTTQQTPGWAAPPPPAPPTTGISLWGNTPSQYTPVPTGDAAVPGAQPTATTPTQTTPTPQTTSATDAYFRYLQTYANQPYSDAAYKKYANARQGYEAERAYKRSSPTSEQFKPQWTYPADELPGGYSPRYMTQDEAKATAVPSVKVKGQFSNKNQYISWLISTYGTKQLAARYGIKRKDITAKQLREKLSVRIKGWPGKGKGGTGGGDGGGGGGERPPGFRGPPPPPRRPSGRGGGGQSQQSRQYYRGPTLPPATGVASPTGRYYNPQYFGMINWRF